MSTMLVTSFVNPPPPPCMIYGTHVSTCVAVTCRRLSPFSHGIQAVDVPVYAFPKLIFMECMFACLFVSASKYKIRIQQKLGLLRGRCHPPMLASSNAGQLLGQAHTVYTLLFEYIPALFLSRHLVRECSWSACSGEVAHKVLRYCYVTLTHLLYEFRYNVEYLRTLGTTLYSMGQVV